jgi:hypothetical protein
VVFLVEFFFMVNGIDIPQLNLRPFKNSMHLNEINSKNVFFLHA